MTDTNNIEVLRAVRSVFDHIPQPCAERDALDAAITALSARASAGEGEPIGYVDPQRIHELKEGRLNIALFAERMGGNSLPLYAATPQPAQVGASGGGEHEKMAAYLTQAIKDSEAGKTVYVRLTPGEVEECVTLLRTPASPATERQADEQYRGEEWQCCGNEKSGSCCGKYERVWHEDDDATPQPAAAQGGRVPTAGVVVSNGGVTWWDEVPEPGTSVYTQLLAAAPQPQERDSRWMARTEITREDFGPAGEPGDTNYQRWLDQSRATPPAHGDGEGEPVFHLRSYGDVSASDLAALTTRPTPEAQEARDADTKRLNYIERTFSGVTNRERYLPVQMIWGKGCNGRTLREACDKYMKRDAALALPAQGEGNSG